MVILIGLIGGIGYYRYNHFNQNVVINGINVGGLNAKQTLKRLQKKSVSQKIYLKNKLIYQYHRSGSDFTDKDLPQVKQLIKRQWTFFPSSKQQSFLIEPSEVAKHEGTKTTATLKAKLIQENRQRKSPKDAYAVLTGGKIKIIQAKAGNKYNLQALLKQYRQQQFLPKVKLTAVYLQPVKAKSQRVQHEKRKLEQISKRSVEYQVQNNKYNFSTKSNLQRVTYANGKYKIESTNLTDEIAKINQQDATLQKGISFKTHDGNTVQIADGGSYGWALKSEQAVEHIEQALLKGKKSLEAKQDIYGVGYLTYGTGYGLSNNGIGDSYAEVSISQQHLWIYKNGQEVVSTNVVTGKHSTGEDTPKGLWYIMYKQSPSVLKGSEAGNANYSVNVNYWAQFTSSGCGFHDASWRTNWASDAYLNNGSGGCVNTPSNVMANVYNNLSQKEAVVVY
ncbi:L,D-transpeptidase family protein [Liquorilactobacillus sicerae]|uniref:L,D-transpeptidase family protein n=1 Tax=Liquorilactobacillus sicerae TaxID=1416943 RepID=UPI0024807F64